MYVLLFDARATRADDERDSESLSWLLGVARYVANIIIIPDWREWILQ